jgi:RHS repeat-associated protein
MSTHIPAINYPINTASGAFAPVMMYNYRYDQLNRIKRMDAYCGYNNVGQHWGNSLMNNKLSDYRERISYDANGNILKYFRNGTVQGSRPLGMDSLTYKYYAGTNKLRQVRDSVPGGNYTEDIDNQSDTSNYVYDEIGNLIQDKAEGIDSIRWTVYGKIRDIYKHSGTIIRYEYDGSGNRISKTVKNGSDSTTTWYVRDATGNVMSVYRLKTDTTEQQEVHLYGSSRLGIIKPIRHLTLEDQYGDTSSTLSLLGTWRGKVFRRGLKFFELSNHLGNVLVTITDRKQQIPKNDTLLKYYEPDVVTATDYAPFGMQLVGRTFRANSNYRYGFQGQEKDDEIKGEGNLINYAFRIYDSRIGRFLSIDPITEKYPFYSPYHFSSNQPIHASEFEGLESTFDLNLPSSPEFVDESHWKFDPTHKDPNSYKWADVNGNKLYWTQGQKDQNGNAVKGWTGKDHYHFEDARGRRYNAAGNLAKAKGASDAHLTPGTQTSIKVKVSVTTTEVNGVAATTTKTTPTPQTGMQKINGTLKSVFVVADLASTVTGIVTGDPDAVINQFGGAQVGQLKSGTLDPYEMGVGGADIRLFSNYYMITKELTNEWSENGAKYKTVTRYVQHYESKQKVNGKYIGQGEVGPAFNQTQTYKNGKLIDQGKLNNPANFLN